MRKWLAEQPIQAASVLGLILYASFRLDYFLFYGPFNVTPEEVGLTYTTTLAQSLLGALILIGVLGLPLTAIVMFYGALFRSAAVVTRSLIKSRGWIFILVWAAALIVVSTVFVGLMRHIQPAFFARAGDTGMIFVTAFTTLFLWGLLALRVQPAEPSQETVKSAVARLLRPTLVTFLVLALLCLLVLLPVLARLDARAVEQGHARDGQIAGLLNLSWGADVAEVHWLGEATSSELKMDGSRCLMYLGRANGVIVLYDASLRRVLRIPGNDVALVAHPDRDHCGTLSSSAPRGNRMARKNRSLDDQGRTWSLSTIDLFK